MKRYVAEHGAHCQRADEAEAECARLRVARDADAEEYRTSADILTTEREACAKACDDTAGFIVSDTGNQRTAGVAAECARFIRSRAAEVR